MLCRVDLRIETLSGRKIGLWRLALLNALLLLENEEEVRRRAYPNVQNLFGELGIDDRLQVRSRCHSTAWPLYACVGV